MLERIKKVVEEHIEAAKKHKIEYLPWDVGNAYLLVKLSEQVASLREKAPTYRHLQEDQHDSIMIAFYLSPETAQQLAIPGGEPAEELHCTLAYLGKVDDLRLGVEHLKYNVGLFVSSRAPTYFSGNIGGLGRFCPSKHSDGLSPIVALMNVHGLQAFRRNLKSALGSSGIWVANNYDYLPHITLAYVDPDAPMPVQNIEPLPLTFDTLWLCIGDQRIPYPLGRLPDQTYHYKFEMIGKDGQVLARQTDDVVTWEGFDRLISGGTPHVQEEKNTQDTKESVETLPEDDGDLTEEEDLRDDWERSVEEMLPEEDLGDPLDWSDADLDEMSRIGADDLANAVKLWDDNAPQGFAGLLNAEVEKG
jgi:2'-5' RNA ligase